jgi:hypothetical protein
VLQSRSGLGGEEKNSQPFPGLESTKFQTTISGTKFEVFTELMIQVKVFWVVTSCSVAEGYKRFGEPCCLQLYPEIWRQEILRNFCILPQHYVTSKSRTRLVYSPKLLISGAFILWRVM